MNILFPAYCFVDNLDTFKYFKAAGEDLEAVSKFLDTAGQKLDYRRYGVSLIEILVAGGLLGNVIQLML